MKGRRYTKQIAVWQTAGAADGYGGNVTADASDTLLGTSWARIKTIRPQRLLDYGITDVTHAIEVGLRYRIDLDYEQEGIYFKYDSESYVFHSVNPIDLEGIDVVVIATKI